MPSPTVTRGLYRFFTRAELDAERLRYKAEVKSAGTTLAGVSVNGQSLTFNIQGREITLPEWADAIAAAYCQLGITDYGQPSSTRAVADYRDC